MPVLQAIVRSQMKLAMKGSVQAQRAVLALVREIEAQNEAKVAMAGGDSLHSSGTGTDEDSDGWDSEAQDLEAQDLEARDLEAQNLETPELEARSLEVQNLEVVDLDEPASRGRHTKDVRHTEETDTPPPPAAPPPSWPEPDPDEFSEPRRFRAPSDEPPVIPWSQRPSVPWAERHRKPPPPPRPDRYSRRRDEW
jgi:hypothetical protein